MSERLILKWGTVKGWNNLSSASQKLLEKFFADGVTMSAAMDHPSQERRTVLCELIDQIDGEIWNDWSGEKMTKEEAKKYVQEYQS